MKKSKSLILLCMTCLVLGGCDFGSSSSSNSNSSSSSSSSEVIETGYAIIGDFVDGDWNPSVEENSKYYIAPGKATYTLEATFVDSKEEPGFRVVEYATYQNYLDYSNLDTSSTGVLDHTDSSNNVLVSPGATLSITFNLGENKSILVTDSSASGEATNGQYVLYGSFKEESNEWNESNTNETYLLPYVTTDPSSKYWQRTVTLAPTSQYEYDPSFRIIEFGDYDKTIAGYSNLTVTSNTSVTVSEGDSDNLKLPTSYAGEKLDLTIDLRNSEYTINIDTHDASFTECDGYPDSTGGESGSGSGSEDTGSGQTNYDSYYSLVGDFIDASWEGWPSEDSIYYLGYDSSDNSTKYWERTVTMADEPTDNEWWSDTNQWNASFYVASVVWNGLEGDESNDIWTLIAGYNHLASGSTGVLGSSSDGGIEVSWNKTYDLVIDLRGSTPSILVTELVDTGEGGSTNEPPADLNLSANYYLVGDYSGGWVASTAITLPYDPNYSDSLYWQRTITMPSNQGWDNPGFRVVEIVNNNWTTIVNTANATVDSASTGYASGVSDSDYNFKLLSWDTSYDITIDMRGSETTVLIDTHVDGFDGNVNGLYDGSANTGDEYEALYIDDDYIMGADISSIAEVEAAGGKFYDYDGNSVDLISYLASQGINYARLRLWYDPTDSDGKSYLGGSNDLDTDLAIAKRCVQAGMKICLDLQYSDFWAHHGQQYAPKEWASNNATTKISNASTWTTNVLNAFKNANCTPSMVQVGNETNNNEICGLTGNSNDALNFFKTCCSAVRTFDSSIQIVIHYADDQNVNTYESYLNSLINNGCDFDVIGLSYYPFWHEYGQTTTSFKNTLSSLDNYYATKKVCIMEYSYAFTTSWQSGNNTMNNSFWTTEEEYAGVSASVSNQKRVIYDINSVAASINGCLGSFYWEPGWLAVSGSAWASSASASYYQSNGVSTSGYSFDTCSWSNQALFDYNGVALDSLKIYNTMWGK
ncbi:MAG: glycosyl hydrolase 53 family protein [Coprobacillus sp.]|nr:glycosyl hydrolase 53 family protein [Coprobacillus sp.]